MKLLLVDDDADIINMYTTKFKEAGIDFDIARNGQEALDKIKKQTYDILLLDIEMPVMGGLEVLQQIKKENLLPGAKIIVLSNRGQKEEVDQGKLLGADDYLIKASYTPSEVLGKVQQHLGENK